MGIVEIKTYITEGDEAGTVIGYMKAKRKKLGETEEERNERLEFAKKNKYTPENVERLHSFGIKRKE